GVDRIDGQRQFDVGKGQALHGRRDIAFTGNVEERLQNLFVADIPRTDLLLDHVEASAFEFGKGGGVHIFFECVSDKRVLHARSMCNLPTIADLRLTIAHGSGEPARGPTRLRARLPRQWPRPDRPWRAAPLRERWHTAAATPPRRP